MADLKLAPNHKDLEQMNEECKSKYDNLFIKEYKHEIRGKQNRKYVLVSDGIQEKWMMWDNLMKRGCKFSKPTIDWNDENIQNEIVKMGYSDIKLIYSYIPKPSSPKRVVLTNGKITIDRIWRSLLDYKKIEFESFGVYKDSYIKELIDTNMFDCEIVELDESKDISKHDRLSRIKITYIYKKRYMTNTLKWALKREFEKAMNEDTLKEKYPTIEWERFKILRIYSERKSGKYRTLVDIKDEKYDEIKVGMDTSNLPIPTMSGLNLSEGELKIREWLIENNIEYETEKTFYGLVYKQSLRLDFYLPKLNIAIEFDGAYHFHAYDWVGGEPTLEINKLRDSIKDKFCKDNNIKLIRIPYWEYKNIANILTQDIV